MVFLKGHQQEPLISFATKDFYGLFSLFSRLLALQNLSVLREVPIPPYSQTPEKVAPHAMFYHLVCLDGLAPWTST
jgi:hypothetical protein